MRFLSFLVAGFLFFASLESWAGYWLAGRWFIGSRFASVSLATVKSWMDRGIIRPTTQTAKVFVNRYGKIILLTLGLSEVIKEVERLQSSTQVCYLTTRDERFDSVRCYVGSLNDFFCYGTRDTRDYFTISPEIIPSGGPCGISRSIPGYSVYRWNGNFNRWEKMPDRIPVEGKHFIGRTSDGRECYLNVSINISPCPFSSSESIVSGYSPSVPNLREERRRVPVRAYPNPSDFVRPDIIEGDPSLKWLRDEYNRIARDPAIPQISPDALGDLELPRIDWDIPEEEAIDSTSRSSRDTPSTDAPRDRPADRPEDRERDRDRSDDLPSPPGLDTSLPTPEKRPFPVELINSLVQNHPLLRVLQGITFDAGSGGSCVIGSGVFTIEFCDHAWVLNLMGAIIVPVAFIVGFIGWRND